MPEEDGYQLVEQLRRRGIAVPAAALTSFAGDAGAALAHPRPAFEGIP
jgi:CheY-like chemotaxis protein